MPTITYSYGPSELIDWVEESDSLSETGGGVQTPTIPSDGLLDLEATAEISGAASGDLTDSSTTTGSLNYIGEIDISNIPSDALITNIVLRIAASVSAEAESGCDGTSTNAGTPPTKSLTANANAIVNPSIFVYVGPGTPSLGTGGLASDNDSDSDNSVASGTSLAVAANAASTKIDSIDFTENDFINLGGIDKASFIAGEYNKIRASIQVALNVNATINHTGTNLSEASNLIGAAAGEAHLTDWEYEITFETEDTDVPIVEVEQSGEAQFSGGGAEFYQIIQDISGIYVLTPGKRDDSWYDRNGGAGATIDVKIPDPFVSLAFLPED